MGAETSVEVYPLLARGVFATYGYFVVDAASGHALLIDPGAQADLFLKAIREKMWTVEAVLLTHGHFDHMGAANALRDALDVPILAHTQATRYLENPELNLSASHGLDIRVQGVVTFEHGASIPLANGKVFLEVAHVPGHTDDSCAFLLRKEGIAFVGDTVYEGGPGLTVFPTGDECALRKGIESRLLTLPEDTLLLSGHSQPTTVHQLRRAIA
ncbi:MAG: MBL fold metallo-hydrolase [Olsenella sp.]|nr:MBL fold metallo-hydrolase [Olsenella sp.]